MARLAPLRISRALLAVATSLALCFAATTASADEIDEPPPASAQVPSPIESHPIEKSYWWQTVAVDSAAFGIFAVGVHGEEVNILGPVALGNYLLGAPIVHLAHGSARSSLGSLGVRLGAPVAAGFLGGLLAGKNVPTIVQRCAEPR